jgi:hypothetical protein
MGEERVGNAQRGAVLDLLGRALEEGYLDLDEYEARLQRVTEGKTVAALHAQVADLPPQFRWDHNGSIPKSRQERAKESANAMAVASIALGVAAIPTSLCFGAGAIPGIAALFFARRALRQEDGRGKAITGLVLGIVGTALSIGIVLLFLLSPEETTVS